MFNPIMRLKCHTHCVLFQYYVEVELLHNVEHSLGYNFTHRVTALSVFLNTICLCFFHFLLSFNNRSIPDYLVWMKYISWFSYGNEMMVINQWEDVSTISNLFNSLVGFTFYNLVHMKFNHNLILRTYIDSVKLRPGF